MKRHVPVFLSLLFYSTYCICQHGQMVNPWEFLGASVSSLPQNKQIAPGSYGVYKLSLPKLKSLLENAPVRQADAKLHSLSLALPMPDGSFQTFHVFEAPVFHPDLAKKYPEIKSYAGYGIEDPTAYLRFDVSPRGFHAMILTDNTSDIFIDPYSLEDLEHYVVYHKKDFYTDKDFQCLEGQAGSTGEPNVGHGAAMAGDCKLRTYALALACTGEYAAFHGGTVAGALAGMNTTMTRVNGVFEKNISVTMQLVANNDLLVFTNAATDPYSNYDAVAMLAQNKTTCDNTIGSSNYDIGHVFSTGGGGLAYVKAMCSNAYKAGGVTGIPSPVGDPFDIDYVCHEMGHQLGANHTQNNACSNNANTAMEPGSGSTIMGYAGVCVPNI